MLKLVAKEIEDNKISLSPKLTKIFFEKISKVPGCEFNKTTYKWEIPKENLSLFTREIDNLFTFEMESNKENINKVSIKERGQQIEIVFKYDQEIIQIVKTIEGKKYNANEKIWTVPLDKKDELLSKLKNYII